MATVHGIPGEWARVRGTIFGLWPLFLTLFLCGIFTGIAILVSFTIGAILILIALFSLWFMLLKGLRHVERFYKGARGEEKVAGILEGLPSHYHVFNDFDAMGHHIDHVVVGPAGVFSIETKFWSERVSIEDGHILVGGRLPSRPPLFQTRREAQFVRQELEKSGWKGKVTPVLAFASDTFEAHVAELQGVVILNSNELKGCFNTQRVVIDPVELERVISLMENSK